MLPRPYLLCRRDAAGVRPQWLEPRHDAWLRTAVEAFDACSGLPAAEVEARGQAFAGLARSRGVSDVAAAGVWHVLRRWSTTVVEAPVAPPRFREEAFGLAAALSIDGALATLVERYRAPPDRLKTWLYADLPGARCLRTKELPSPEALRDAYNMALAQGVVGRCSHVAFRVEENVRAMVRAAKLRGLLVSVDADGPVVRASGPLALFRQTTKYAHAMAHFVPALVSMPGWSLEGALYLGATPERLLLDAASPLPRTWKLPARTDSALEAALLKALRRTRSDWSVAREPIVLRAGAELFFPDFVLVRGADRVIVEVVGYWTPEYLERKVTQLSTVSDLPLVVCVDETLACDPSRLPRADVVRFKRRLDPTALLAAAERALGRWNASSAPRSTPPATLEPAGLVP